VSIAAFALCIAPTFVSYAPYSFRWDDSGYLWRSVAASKAFWSGNWHELRIAIGDHGPVMSLLGLPWGPLAAWDAAGKCFITLAALTAFFVAMCLFLLLRVGLKPVYLMIASACVFAALGPYFTDAKARYVAAGLMVDSLLAWDAFAAILLIPYEATTYASATTDALVRGILWAIVFSVGAMTKASFLYFIGLIIPTLFFIRMRNNGLRSALLSSISLIVCSFPVIIYWLRYGLRALEFGWANSFGHLTRIYTIPFWQFLSLTVRQSPGMLLSGMSAIGGIAYLLARRRDALWSVNLLSLLIMVGYCTICLASSNREIRFLFPGIIALPFLIEKLICGKTPALSRGPAATAAILVFCFMVAASVPTLHRANRRSIALSEAVLAQAVDSNAKHILLVTDSSSLNDSLMRLAIEVSPLQPSIETASLAWRADSGVPIEKDFRDIREADIVVFQNTEALDSPQSIQRVPEYEQCTRQQFGDAPIKVVDGLRIYGVGPDHR